MVKGEKNVKSKKEVEKKVDSNELKGSNKDKVKTTSSKKIQEVIVDSKEIIEKVDTENTNKVNSLAAVKINKLVEKPTKNVVVKKENKRTEKLEKLVESLAEPKVKHHILYVSHLPWGTDESFVKKYFEQFGTIVRYYLPRSKTTGRIRGFCFIEFDSNETCKIAAQTMNNYILFEKILKCQVIEDSTRFNGNWRNHYKYVNKYKIFVEKRNSKKSINELKERVSLYLKKEEEKRKKLEEIGIKYDFPGFKACLSRKS